MNLAFWRRKSPERCEIGPDEMIRPVEAQFVGTTRRVRTRYSGLTYDVVHKIAIEKVVSLDQIDDRHVALSSSGKRVLRQGDLKLAVEIDGQSRLERFRDVVISRVRRDPNSGQVIGVLVADQIVPRPPAPLEEKVTPLENLPADNATAGEHEALPVPRKESSKELTRIEPTAELVKSGDGTAASLASESANAPAPVPGVGFPLEQPDKAGPVLRSYSHVEASALLQDRVLLLEGTAAGDELSQSYCVAGVTVRCRVTGIPLAGTVRVGAPREAVLVGPVGSRGFGLNGMSLLGPPGAYVLEVAAVGYRDASVPIELTLNGPRMIDVQLDRLDSRFLQFHATLSLDDSSIDLQFHLLHIGHGPVSFHVSRHNSGSLERWPYAAIRELDDDHLKECLEIAHVLRGATFCLVHNFTHRDQPESKALAASGAVVALFDGTGQSIAQYRPGDAAGNLWCPFVLANGEPIEIPQRFGNTPRVTPEAIKSWVEDQSIRSRVLPETNASSPQGVSESQAAPSELVAADWWFLICAFVGLALAAFIWSEGLPLGALVMLAVTGAVLYYVHQGGHPMWPGIIGRRPHILRDRKKSASRMEAVAIRTAPLGQDRQYDRDT